MQITNKLCHISSRFERSKLDMSPTSEKKGLTKADAICMKYILAGPHNILFRGNLSLSLLCYHIKRNNEIPGSMTLTASAVIEFANETRDDTVSSLDGILSLKRASYIAEGSLHIYEKNTRSRDCGKRSHFDTANIIDTRRTGKRNG